MKALVYEGPRTVSVREMKAPEGQGVRLRLRYCGVCGTDIGIYSGSHPRAQAPLVLGHEFIGEVIEDAAGFTAGQRVTAFPLLSCGSCHPCRTGSPHICASLRLLGIDQDGGMAEEMIVQPELLVPVPDHVSDQLAALIEPVAVCLRVADRAGVTMGDTCVVTGAGPIGLITALMLRHAGAGRILVSDIAPGRLKLARDLGLETVNVSSQSLAGAVAEATGGDGADVLVECSGAAPVALEMTRLVRTGGTLCLASLYKAPVPVPLLDMSFKELRLIGSRVYTREEFRRAVDLVAKLEEPLLRLVTQVVPLSGAGDVFDLVTDPTSDAVKVLVDCQA
ncbi:zinc-binding dehydrogenase [Salipiger sp. PrR002]|uniref:zinc-dependent alcohol dehydrogenase n=1 Tax=Salipiger sp. PrR002 TaxID=2706489 RepID=UPI0013BD0491|nr:alcohol dehydrogenase catalytic domain-containing protein [Salipiger sp. PrR002]NDW00891.1 alcohol dehydrogenase catalytic domain-containing protein [Salipiger sp. PrR002]NDW57988.1 alcohol dehydrogenase catalytic domain-containing protein [Salipiger sp. PrR004]